MMRKLLPLLLLGVSLTACAAQVLNSDIPCRVGHDDDCPTDNICGEDGRCRATPKCTVGVSQVCGGACVPLNLHDSCGACATSDGAHGGKGTCSADEVCNVGDPTDFRNSVCAAHCQAGLSLCTGNVCVDEQSDVANCGGCGVPGAAPGAPGSNKCSDGYLCNAGRCTLKCQAGLDICGGKCVDRSADRNNCGTCGTACTAGQICESGLCTINCLATEKACTAASGNGKICTDTQTDAANCGLCSLACDPGNRCVEGHCLLSCQPGLDICNGKCVDLTSDRNNCGACGKPCGSGQICSGSTAATATCINDCPAAQTSCPDPLRSGGSACVDFTSDPQSCGSCGKTCPAGNACVASACQPSCQSKLTLCPPLPDLTGTCVDTTGDTANCGACGNPCAAGQVCQGSKCVLSCQAGLTRCNAAGGGLVCVNAATDPNNCGGCAGSTDGHVCKTGESCNGFACVPSCPAGSSRCTAPVTPTNPAPPTLCVNVKSDNVNCGACNVACAAGQACVSGACAPTCASGQQACGAPAACTNVLSDPNNCGGCDVPRASTHPHVCGDGQACRAGLCQTSCGPNLSACGDNLCHDLQNDAGHCGTCGNFCSAGQICSGGKCSIACGPGQTPCGAFCTSTAYDPSNCGTCGTSCGPYANAAALCSSSTCIAACQAGFADCDRNPLNGCEVNLAGDPANCGGCGNACPVVDNSAAQCTAGPSGAGTCSGFSCALGFKDCDSATGNGCESDSAHDSANCGACSTSCSVATPFCSASGCTAQRPAGVMQNVQVAALTTAGFRQCFLGPYGTAGGTLGAVLATCTGPHVVLGCLRSDNPGVLLVAAEGPTGIATGSGQAPANGVTFYQTSAAWGFAPQGVPLDVTAGCDGNITSAASQRLCWSIEGGSALSAGTRCGDATGLTTGLTTGTTTGTTYQRVIFTD